MEHKVLISGHTVAYEDSVKQGIYYLTRQLDSREVTVYFDQAFSHGFAYFEDQMGYNYKLVHNGAEYKLVRV